MDRFLLMTCFARAVETGSFSAAGRDLGLGQPNVSRYVAALEDHLHARLLQRSTRRLSLTPEGERYYAEVRRILDAVDDAESSFRGDAAPAGLLRVACPTALAHAFVLPTVPDFLARYPGLELDLQIGDRYVNLIDEGAELAIRIGHLEDSALRARRIGLFERVCVASRDYLARHAAPLVPDDLRKHDCIVYTLLSSGHTWRFRDQDVPVSGRLRVNSPQAAQEAVGAGIGIAHGPRWLFEGGLKDGSLELLLSGYAAPPVPIQILYVANRLLPKRAIAFIEFIAREFATIPALNVDAAAPFRQR
ncbi:LysR family transcriptional regulator [Paraburkholderia caballeronis]|uniref:DNA-binding transcriptional regulator, LysR family n=1 Tax=Paraburkholderia caballeronis TaxID=416943 RepID=A0A1H7G5J4_9BURK|nr:LysR family transcriptional regulator [Paraburkholderia caballeronis]PXW24702.1 LysR family transcriptional regulator [Paraburkholderia caballeronis]PXX00432.1 LysR family transcriptional regulator [Paraburkholderia caballeronis]RAJ98495.1 LysR family transcriptional regulator [Paraburkholderia caballeronis]SEE65106.1 transcriptional regulator, LysR family [Paraburkholderia caballeronis]SEK33344.1 DNA-binding transcriptional regulator, LysR family [Paraburkholderia caballeronis]